MKAEEFQKIAKGGTRENIAEENFRLAHREAQGRRLVYRAAFNTRILHDSPKMRQASIESSYAHRDWEGAIKQVAIHGLTVMHESEPGAILTKEQLQGLHGFLAKTHKVPEGELAAIMQEASKGKRLDASARLWLQQQGKNKW